MSLSNETRHPPRALSSAKMSFVLSTAADAAGSRRQGHYRAPKVERDGNTRASWCRSTAISTSSWRAPSSTCMASQRASLARFSSGDTPRPPRRSLARLLRRHRCNNVLYIRGADQGRAQTRRWRVRSTAYYPQLEVWPDGLDCVESDMGKANGVWSVAKHSASPAIRPVQAAKLSDPANLGVWKSWRRQGEKESTRSAPLHLGSSVDLHLSKALERRGYHAIRWLRALGSEPSAFKNEPVR